MEKNNYNILVLSDLKGTSKSTLKSAISLAKMIGGSIDLFYVKKPTDVVVRENQLSAIRSINEEHYLIRKKAQEYILPVSEAYEMPITYNFAIGNVKNEIENYIHETQPDVVVLGKRKPKRLKFIGESTSNYILNNYKGIVFMVSENNSIEPGKKLVLGMLNNKADAFNATFTDNLIAHTDTPIKSFKVVNKTDSATTSGTVSANGTVDYVFEDGDKVVKNISKYLTINKINLLLISRENKYPFIHSTINGNIDYFNNSILLDTKKINNLKKKQNLS